MSTSGFPASSRSTSPLLERFTLSSTGVEGAFVRLENLVYYAPFVAPKPGTYTLSLFSPLAAHDLPFRVYVATPEGEERRVALKKADLEESLPDLYLFEALTRFNYQPTLMTVIARNLAAPLGEVPKIAPDTLTRLGWNWNLVFRSSHFAVHQVPGMMTTVEVTTLGDRLLRILTSF